jgi:hypothetical protein
VPINSPPSPLHFLLLPSPNRAPGCQNSSPEPAVAVTVNRRFRWSRGHPPPNFGPSLFPLHSRTSPTLPIWFYRRESSSPSMAAAHLRTARLQPPLLRVAGCDRCRWSRSRVRLDALHAVVLLLASGNHRSIARANHQCTSPANLAGNLTRWAPPLPSHLDHRIVIRCLKISHLTEGVLENLVCPDPFESDGS